jgi:prolyl-tRNA editing enzyme YbaK/EbsC (Cys-tRNA(Pro) deacylase)
MNEYNQTPLDKYLLQNDNNEIIGIISSISMPINERYIKSLIFEISNDKYVLVVLDIKKRVDSLLLSKALNIPPGDFDIKLATTDKASEISGCEMGIVPPIGNCFNIPILTIIDSVLLINNNNENEIEFLYGGSMRLNYLLKIQASSIINITDTLVADISMEWKNDFNINNYNNNHKFNINNNNNNHHNFNIITDNNNKYDDKSINQLEINSAPFKLIINNEEDLEAMLSKIRNLAMSTTAKDKIKLNKILNSLKYFCFYLYYLLPYF